MTMNEQQSMRVLRENLKPVFDSDLITDFSPSFAIDLEVLPGDVDPLGHMNNAVYVNWLDQVHLMHAFNLGITPEMIASTGRGLVVRHTNLTYLSAIRVNQIARVGTCITFCDERLRMQRQFQMVLLDDGPTLLRGSIEYVSVDYQRGKPARMPGEFAEALSSAAITPENCY